MEALTVKQLMGNYPECVIFDRKRKEVTIIRDGKMKVYNKPYYEKFVKGVKFEVPG